MNKYNYDELKAKLDRCRNMKLSDINPDDVDELESVKIDKRKSKEERILDFITKTKNPYAFKVNGKLVKIEYSNNGRDAEECIMNVIKSLYR